MPVGRDKVLVGYVVVVAHDAVPLEVGPHEELVFLSAHAVVHEIEEHVRVHPPAVIEIEREKAAGVVEFGEGDRIRAVGVEVLRGLALDEDGVGADIEDRPHGQHIGLDDVLQGRDEGLIARQLLVPPAIGGRERGADEHLVDRRIELNPGKALGKSLRIPGKELGKVGVLEVADPVGNPEVAQVNDRHDIAAVELAEGLVAEVPVVAPLPEPRRVDRRAIPQYPDADFVEQIEVGLPEGVVPALFHLIDAGPAPVDGRIAVLDPRSEQKRRSGHDRPPL